MSLLDRTAVVIRPKEPFLLWCRATDDENALADDVVRNMRRDPTVFLVPPFDDELTTRENLRRVYDVLFEEALAGWSTDEAQWPESRTLEMFEDWFDVEVFGLVDDLIEEE